MSNESIRSFGGFTYSVPLQDVLDAEGNSARLRPQSVEVFRYLANNSERLVTRQELIDNIWPDVAVTDDSLTKCISEIRKVLSDTDRSILTTMPRRGYQLIADETDLLSNNVTDRTLVEKPDGSASWIWFAPVLLLLGIAIYFLTTAVDRSGSETPVVAFEDADGIPALAITSGAENNTVNTELRSELRVALSRYRTVQLVEATEADLHLQLPAGNPDSQTVELIHVASNEVMFADSYERSSTDIQKLAVRVAAAVASPGVGAVDTWLLKSTRLVPADQLGKAACYAHGYGCSKCSGEEDTITRRAEACLSAILEKDPEDARAWALQATIHAHQYWWANTLPEPMRSDPALRSHLPTKAIEAANRAESLSDGYDTAVYWGMAEAYYSACEVDKLKTAIDRGLQINPDDPNLMGAFGNWLAYSGRWQEGAELTLKALQLEPRRYRKWWWMGPAKAAYYNGQYEQAYEYFLKAFNERNWMSHLQLAYTLPHLGRINEARKSVATLQYMYPGFTLEKALEIYDLLCFPDSFLADVRSALTQAGLPSRGESKDLSSITLPRAKVVEVNDTAIEYLDVGAGEPVVFVHGAFNDYRSWGHYMVPVSESHRYISYSRRYFGTQHWQDNGEQFSVDNFASDLIGLLETLQIEGAHVVTWSSGVRTAIAAAVKRPDLFKSLIHFEPVEDNVFEGFDFTEQQQSLQNDWYKRWGPVDQFLTEGDEESALQSMFELVFEMDDGGYLQEREPIRELTRQNARSLPVNLTRFGTDDTKLTCDYVSQVSVPTLVLFGELTHGYWKMMAQRFADCTPGSVIAGISGSNHYAPIEEIQQVTNAVLDFVNR
jgi:DNA-binding winged helix-turn-helix (wHTH) protein/pimeloyl-ACP methyl ester carboxylesterase/Tfp pilus assembly protein PilF